MFASKVVVGIKLVQLKDGYMPNILVVKNKYITKFIKLGKIKLKYKYHQY